MNVQNGIQIGWTSPNLARFTSNSTDSPINLSPDEASWVVSSVGIGGIVGSVLGPLANELLGAKRTILLTFVIVSVEWASLTSKAADLTVEWLYFARALGGMAFSVAMCCFSIYLGEISLPESRGTLISLAMSGTNLGVFVGTITETYFPMRWTSFSYLVVSLLGVFLFMVLRDSAYYLVKVGDFEAARRSIAQYNGGCDVDKELHEIRTYVEAHPSGTSKEKLAEFKKPSVLKSMILVIILFALPHLSGVMAIMSYMETILNDARIDCVDRKEFVVWVQLAGIVTSFLTVNLLDKFGRRAMLVTSGVGVAVALASIGLNFHFLEHESAQWLTIFGMLFYVVTYAVGYAIIPATILGEIFPDNVKSAAALVACTVASLFAFICMKAYQPILDLAGHSGVFFVFALFSATSAPFAIFLLPETRGKTFQQIQEDLAKKS